VAVVVVAVLLQTLETMALVAEAAVAVEDWFLLD
jgi:hypothetical protein